jgi:chromosome segregation ATPase
LGKVEQLTTEITSLRSTEEATLVENASLQARVLSLENEISIVRGQLSNVSMNLGEEERGTVLLREELTAATKCVDLFRTTLNGESNISSTSALLEATQKSDTITHSYDALLRDSSSNAHRLETFTTKVRAFALAFGIPPSNDTSDALNSNVEALFTRLNELESQLATTTSILASARTVSQSILASFPAHYIGPIESANDEGEATLEKNLRQIGDRVSLLVEAVESASSELEESRHQTGAVVAEQQIVRAELESHRRLLSTVTSKLGELRAVCEEREEEGGEGQATTTDSATRIESGALPHLIEHLKAHIIAFNRESEEKSVEVHRLASKVSEEVAKRSKVVVKLEEKTRCVGPPPFVLFILNSYNSLTFYAASASVSRRSSRPRKGGRVAR